MPGGTCCFALRFVTAEVRELAICRDSVVGPVSAIDANTDDKVVGRDVHM